MKAIALGHGNRRPRRDWDRPVRQSVDRRAPATSHNRTKTGADARVPARFQEHHTTLKTLFAISVIAAVASCSGEAAAVPDPGRGPTAPSTPSQIQQAGPFDLEVTRLRVFIKEGRPQAYIEAPLGDSCNSLQQITQRRERNAYRVTMTANREGGTCALLMQYLNEWIPLIGSFRAGTYTLQVNGAHVEFHLINHANGFRIEPDPGPLPSSPPMP